MNKAFALSYIDRMYYLRVEKKTDAQREIKLPDKPKDKNQNPFEKG